MSDKDVWADFKPIDRGSKSGMSIIAGNPETGDQARAYWHFDMWAYYLGPDSDLIQQIDFEPTHYRAALEGQSR